MMYSHERHHVEKGEAHRDGHLGNPVLLARDSSRNYPTRDEKDHSPVCCVPWCMCEVTKANGGSYSQMAATLVYSPTVRATSSVRVVCSIQPSTSFLVFCSSCEQTSLIPTKIFPARHPFLVTILIFAFTGPIYRSGGVTVTLSVHSPVIVNLSQLLHPRLLLHLFLVFSMIYVSHLNSRRWVIY